MSSFARTLQKRILKTKLGFSRQTQKVETDLTGRPVIVRLKRGEGNIFDANGDDTGSKHYPLLVRPTAANG